MTRTRKIITWTMLSASAVSIGHCTYTTSKYTQEFDKTAVGDSESVVIERFGKPDVRESAGHKFLAYVDKPCESPCMERLWWEAPFPMPKGIEAWIVELNSTNHVVAKAHILFP